MGNIDYGRFIPYYTEKLQEKYISADILDLIYNKKVYGYGNQLQFNNENWLSLKKNFYENFFREIYCYYKIISKTPIRNQGKNHILSSAYFGVNSYLRDEGYDVYDGPWRVNGSTNFIRDLDFIHSYYSFLRRVEQSTFINLTSEKTQCDLERLLYKTREVLRKYGFSAFIANSTRTFGNRLPLRAAKQEGIPTVVFLHGLPTADYDDEPDKSDYLIVWSEKIKENAIKYSHYPSSRIYVSGHPSYKSTSVVIKQPTLDNILIICPSTSDSWNIDRGNMLYYLSSVGEVLKKHGVKSVRFRPHPHEDPYWYLNFLDKSFFVVDRRPIDKAISDSSLLIGTTSTVLLESLYKGVNYIVFNPLDEMGNDIYNRKRIAPFDGSDIYLPVANTLADLDYMISNKICVNPKLLEEYIQTPFDISFLKQLI